MTQPKPQSFSNHAKIDPWFHFVAAPLLLINFILGVIYFVLHFRGQLLLSIWVVILSFAALILVAKLRSYALKVQDRVIRLEERLRLAALLPESTQRRIPELTEAQLIALRFASDEELPTLVAMTLDKNLDRKQIKERIQNWRSDHWRV